MDKNLLLAFLLMGAVLFLTPYFYKNVAPPAAKPEPSPTPVAQQSAPAASPAVAAPAGSAWGSNTPSVMASSETSTVIDTQLYRIEFSNRGGVVKSWKLKKYKDNDGQELELVSAAGAQKLGMYPFALEFADKKPSVDLNQVLFAVKTSSGSGSQCADHPCQIDFDYADNGLAVHKSFRFEPNGYLSQFSAEATQNGAPLAALTAWRGGFGDADVRNIAGAKRNNAADVKKPSAQYSVYMEAEGKVVTQAAKAAKNGPVDNAGDYAFAGIEDTYFATVFLPVDKPQSDIKTINRGASDTAGDSRLEVRTLSDEIPSASDATKEEPNIGVAVGTAAGQFKLYVGPKDIEILRKVDPVLEPIVDFGRLHLIAKPLFLIVNWVADHWTNNYGWAIVIVTLGINLVLLPLRFSSMRSMRKMQALKPQIDAINAKYKGVGMRDPRKAEQNKEVMEMYKKHGANPMGGCWPMLIQLPFLWAFYTVLGVAIQMRGAHWLWVTDLSQPEHLAIHVLPVLMIVAQFIMQVMTPNPTMEASQQKMMLFMPLAFGFMFYNMMSGLVLYWLTGNVAGIAQQWVINKTMPLAPPQPAPAVAKRGKSGGGKR